MQALGSYEGGKMLFLGLGTELGSAMIADGVIEPMELAHLPYRKATFEKKLDRPRALWLMVPAAVVDKMIADLLPHLEEGDILIDGGNSYFMDDIRRAKELAPKGIHYLDVGTSGGVWGLKRGYCMMIGGSDQAVRRLDPIFKVLAPGVGDIPRTSGQEQLGGTAEQGYLHCGPSGAGHFVKMVHNGIEYGVTSTEVVARLRRPPSLFPFCTIPTNYFRFRISPDMTIALGATAMDPAEKMCGQEVELQVKHNPIAGEMDACERLLGDAMAGDATSFAREDYVEEAWRIVDPVLKAGTPIHEYEPNTWGPGEVNQLVSPPGGWQEPVVAGGAG
jgi:hypothetical protein